MQHVKPEVREKWEALNAEIEEIKQTEKDKLCPGRAPSFVVDSGGHLPLPILGLRTGTNVFPTGDNVHARRGLPRLRNAIGEWSSTLLASPFSRPLPSDEPPSEALASSFSAAWSNYQQRREEVGIGRNPDLAIPYP